jgi:hypothetical protein
MNRAPVSKIDPKILFLRCAIKIESKYKLFYMITIIIIIFVLLFISIIDLI